MVWYAPWSLNDIFQVGTLLLHFTTIFYYSLEEAQGLWSGMMFIT